jgi:hypothetical protein
MDTAIEVERGPGPESGSYIARVLRSVGGGEPVETITLHIDELVSGRPLVEASILSSSVSTRRIMSDTEAAVQRVGVRLFDATFTGDIRAAYRTSAATHLFDIEPIASTPTADAAPKRWKAAGLVAAANRDHRDRRCRRCSHPAASRGWDRWRGWERP